MLHKCEEGVTKSNLMTDISGASPQRILTVFPPFCLEEQRVSFSSKLNLPPVLI